MNIINKGYKLIGKIGVDKLVIIFLAGVLLIIISLPSGRKATENINESSSQNESAAIDYEEYLEKKLSDNLSCIEGLGKTRVMITLKNDGVRDIKVNIKNEEKNQMETDASGGSRILNEKTYEEEAVLTDNGSNTAPYITSTLKPQIEGVIVISEGGDNAALKMEVIEACEALLNVPSHKVKVLKLE